MPVLNSFNVFSDDFEKRLSTFESELPLIDLRFKDEVLDGLRESLVIVEFRVLTIVLLSNSIEEALALILVEDGWIQD